MAKHARTGGKTKSRGSKTKMTTKSKGSKDPLKLKGVTKRK